jgi:FtsZ-binding cell division protein ZapB
MIFVIFFIASISIVRCGVEKVNEVEEEVDTIRILKELMILVRSLVEGQERLEKEQKSLKEGQERLEKEQEGLKEGLERVEDRVSKMEKGQ